MAPSAPKGEVGTALALAVIAMSQAPLLLLDGDFKVVAASDSFLKDFALDKTAVRGRSLLTLGEGEWALPRLESLLTAIGSGDAEIDAYELEMPIVGGESRSLLINAHRLDFSEAMAVRLLLTIVDVTASNAARKVTEDLIRQKDVLLKEIQHRVANSLQIIASVLLQSARKAPAGEARSHLTDAHHRVMSVASIQQQIAVSAVGEVMMKPYFTQLCRSIGASMIADHDQLQIEVSGDGSVAASDVSVSMGLVVTELVINALKHAFPAGRKGVVSVDYRSRFDGWTLSVSDDGVGMPAGGADPEPGLGTAIVQALAAQLSAIITVADLKPGTGVSLVHQTAGAAAAEHARLHAV